jgi:hypothetical protein
LSSEALWTLTRPAVAGRLYAHAIVQARTRVANVHYRLTMGSREAGQTVTRVSADSVSTQAIVLTRLTQHQTFVHVQLTIRTCPAVRTAAFVRVCWHLQARARIQARVAQANIHVHVTVRSRPAYWFEI